VEEFDIFQDIAERTGGDIYIGVVGPVRTGKSTFIKRFMDLLVLPNIGDPHDRERAKDALPQAGAGLTIMTTEPKFIPDDGVEVILNDNIALRVRLVDCVGFTVDGALGYSESDGPRMVRTPWFDEEVPFQEAAEMGTRKVMEEHSTIGVLVTTDGTITELGREGYVEAERRVVEELKRIGKPFIIVLNTMLPDDRETLDLVASMEIEYDVPVIPMDCLQMKLDDVYLTLEQVLYEFPVKEVSIALPDWVEELDSGHWLRQRLEQAVEECVGEIKRVRDIEKAVDKLSSYDFSEKVSLSRMDMGLGLATVDLVASEDLFFDVLEEISGYIIENKADIIRNVTEMATAKREYDRMGKALLEAREAGYGMVAPSVAEMVFEDPELIRQGSRFGIRLKAHAPSLHFLRADVHTEITPLMGTEKQCEELVEYLLEQFEDNPSKIWESDIFGKPLAELVREGINNKLYRMPDNVQVKLQETLERIVNEGSGGLICIII